MGNSFFSKNELLTIGFKEVGNNCFISRKASFYNTEKIELGNNIRIDDFCILSGRIILGDFIHIAAYSALYGGDEGIYISDFANISSRVVIYALTDDYSGQTMTNPMVSDKYKKVLSSPVHIQKHVIIGTGSTVLPGVVLGEGTAIGAMSLIKESTKDWNIYAGIPAENKKMRKKDILDLEKEFIRFCD